MGGWKKLFSVFAYFRLNLLNIYVQSVFFRFRMRQNLQIPPKIPRNHPPKQRLFLVPLPTL